MKKTRRELAQEQLDLVLQIQSEAGINIVTCGHCGWVLLHKLDREFYKEPLVCHGCKREWTDSSDCPDLWYEGCIESSVFDEDEEIEVERFLVKDLSGRGGVVKCTATKLKESFMEELSEEFEQEEIEDFIESVTVGYILQTRTIKVTCIC